MKENHINLIIKWEDTKDKTWSGTPVGISNGLKNHNIEVADYNLRASAFQEFVLKSVKKMFSIIGKSSFSLYDLYLQKYMLHKMIRLETVIRDIPTIMFWSLNSKLTPSSYIFLDLSVDFIYRMYAGKSDLSIYTPLKLNTPKYFAKKRQSIEHDFFMNCKGVFTMSEWLREDIIKNTGLPEGKVHAVGGGCNIDVSQIDDSEKQGNKLLFVGIDFERKAGVLTVEAFKKLKAKMPEAELYIAGPEKWSVNEEISDGIKFLGRLSTKELPYYYNICDVFVMPSYFEAYGLVFAESLIYGLPCIARNAYAMKEFVQDGKNGYLINNDDSDELADRMYKALNNKEMQSFVKDNRHKYINKYNWYAVADRMLEVINTDFKD